MPSAISPACREAGKPYRFTAESARRAVLARIARKQSEEERISQAVAVAMAGARACDFHTIRLAKLREDITRADEKSRSCTHPDKALAWAKLAAELQEQERILAGRPLPGRKDARRPDAPRPPAVPLPDEPEPAPGPG